MIGGVPHSIKKLVTQNQTLNYFMQRQDGLNLAFDNEGNESYAYARPNTDRGARI
jgi:hypothetical protein